MLEARTAFWTPAVTISPREIDRQLPRTCQKISWEIEYARDGNIDVFEHRDSRASGLTELLIIDEADRLKPPALEQVRNYYDRHTMGVIHIGMLGFEKRLARYPQLYSRIGFAHHYRTLSTEELTFVQANRWQELGLTIDPHDFTDAEAIAAVARVTNGNFRLIQRLSPRSGESATLTNSTASPKKSLKQRVKPYLSAPDRAKYLREIHAE